MRIKQFIPDDQTRSKVQALAEARRLPVRQEGPWVIFEAVYYPDPVLQVLKAAGLPERAQAGPRQA
jgi:hypothetical protein